MSSALATPEVVATPKPLADITPDIAQRSQAGGKAARYIRSTAWRIAKPSIAIAIFPGSGKRHLGSGWWTRSSSRPSPKLCPHSSLSPRTDNCKSMFRPV